MISVTSRVADTSAEHQSSGCCSLPPSGVVTVSIDRNALATNRPSAVIAPTFRPPVPRSIPRYQGGECSVEGGLMGDILPVSARDP